MDSFAWSEDKINYFLYQFTVIQGYSTCKLTVEVAVEVAVEDHVEDECSRALMARAKFKFSIRSCSAGDTDGCS